MTKMDTDKAEQIARLLQQYHDGFSLLVNAILPDNADQTIADIMARMNTPPPMGGMAFGFAALAIIYSYESVSGPFGHPSEITEVIDLTKLGVVQNNQCDKEGPQLSCFRHLRNCLAHGAYKVTVAGTITTVTLRDVNSKGSVTFLATCAAQDLIGTAEEILIKAHAVVAAYAKIKVN